MRRGQEKGKYHDERHCARNVQRSSFGIRLLTYTPFSGRASSEIARFAHGVGSCSSRYLSIQIAHRFERCSIEMAKRISCSPDGVHAQIIRGVT